MLSISKKVQSENWISWMFLVAKGNFFSLVRGKTSHLLLLLLASYLSFINWLLGQYAVTIKIKISYLIYHVQYTEAVRFTLIDTSHYVVQINTHFQLKILTAVKSTLPQKHVSFWSIHIWSRWNIKLNLLIARNELNLNSLIIWICFLSFL